MNYVYAVAFAAAGLLLIVRMGRENRMFYPLGAYFLFLGGWWGVSAAAGINLFSGVYGRIFRVVTAIALAVAILAFYREKKRN